MDDDERSTPTCTPPEVTREVSRARASSQYAVRLADTAAIEILRTTGVTYAYAAKRQVLGVERSRRALNPPVILSPGDRPDLAPQSKVRR